MGITVTYKGVQYNIKVQATCTGCAHLTTGHNGCSKPTRGMPATLPRCSYERRMAWVKEA